MMVTRSLRAVALAGATALAVAACGSSTHAGSPPTTGSANRGTGGTASPSGTPLKVLAVTNLIDPKGEENGLKLAEAYINATGGIKGRPLQIIACNDNNNPNNAATCVRNGISQGAVAEIDRVSSNGATMDPLEQAGGLATLGGGIFSQADFAAANLY